MVFLDHTQRRTTTGSITLDEWSARLRETTQCSYVTNIHAPFGIRTHDLSRRTAVDIRLGGERPFCIWHNFIRRRYLKFLTAIFLNVNFRIQCKRQQDASKIKWHNKVVSIHGANTEVCLVIIELMFQKRKDVIKQVCVYWWLLSWRMVIKFPNTKHISVCIT